MLARVGSMDRLSEIDESFGDEPELDSSLKAKFSGSFGEKVGRIVKREAWQDRSEKLAGMLRENLVTIVETCYDC
jgi:hypothetical protein